MPERRSEGDDEIVEQIQRGDQSAIKDLFNNHFESLVDYAASFVRSAEAAEDIIADIFSSIVANPKKFSPSQSIRAYLLWMVRNRALDVLRGLKREQDRYSIMATRGDEAIIPAGSPPPDELLSVGTGQSDIGKVSQALDSLAPVTRSIVLLRLRQGLEYPEIAQVVGLSETAVRMQLSRALRTLRDRL